MSYLNYKLFAKIENMTKKYSWYINNERCC